MTVFIKSHQPGIRHASALVPNVAATTPLTLYALPTGVKKAIIRKIWGANRNAAPSQLQIGTGLGGAWLQLLPQLFVVNGMDFEFTEEQIPCVEFNGNITMQCTVAAAAPNTVDVQIEVEEIGA